MPPPILLGTAGWSIPSTLTDRFPAPGTHLQRYARQFPAAEINSSFHRPHRPATYARWADSTPPAFRFAAKLPKTITHQRRLVDADAQLAAFLAEVAELGDKLAVVLAQLPPSLAFDAGVASAFLRSLTARTAAAVACEPRHPTWFSPEADALLAEHRVARVAAHPVLAPGGERPGGWPGLRYHRLHGAPRMYYSPYSEPELRALAATLTAGNATTPRWCMFDNTASGAATADALALRAMLSGAA